MQCLICISLGDVCGTVLVRKSLDLVFSLYEAQMSALAILSQPRKRSVVQISESRPGHFASICRHCPTFAKLIRRCWFATVVVMSERSTEPIHEQIRELLDSLYRLASAQL